MLWWKEDGRVRGEGEVISEGFLHRKVTTHAFLSKIRFPASLDFCDGDD